MEEIERGVEIVRDTKEARFDEIDIGQMFYDLTSKRIFIKETKHTAGSGDGAHLEFAPGHLVSLKLEIQMEQSEFTKAEWWLVAQQVRPDWTREQFYAVWDEFVALKASHKEQ